MAFSRNTKQRDAVKSVFEAENRPLSPEEVLNLASKHVPQLGIATVYRSIKGFVEEGLLTSVKLMGEPDRYELAGKDHHHHFRCRKCHKVYEVEGCLPDVNKLVQKGFRVEEHHIMFDGLCITCNR